VGLRFLVFRIKNQKKQIFIPSTRERERSFFEENFQFSSKKEPPN